MNISHPAKGGKKKIPTRRRYASSSPLSNKTSYGYLFIIPLLFLFFSISILEFRLRSLNNLEEYFNFIDIDSCFF